MVVEDDAFVALTMGVLRPRIIISTGLLNMFQEKEAEAILLHEHYHYIHRDPLKSILFTIMVDGLGYIPIIKAIAGYYKIWKELLADRFVIRQMRSEFYLGSVLLCLTKWVNLNRPVEAVYFTESAINYRILQILEPEKPLHIPFLHMKSIMVSVSILFIMVSVVIGGCT
ncbi:MAG TPA: M56 family metallopeptidase [Bacilli bacterium]